MYYAWYNVELDEKKQKDLKMTLNIFNGQADLYISTFVDDQSSSNVVDQLPKSKRDATWVLEGITPKTSLIQRSHVIVN